jgi:undecaprenyl-diphosphatase
MVADGVIMRGSASFFVLAVVAVALFCGVAVAVETNRLAGFDEAIRIEVHTFASPLLTFLAEKITWLGTLGVLTLFGVVAVLVLVHARRRDGAVFLTVTMVGALALENGLKFSFQRVRPPPFFGSEPVTYSFPSGHALFSLCFYGVLAIVARRAVQSGVAKAGIWITTIFLVLAIGGTRIYLGVHYPSDVLGGYLVAIAWIGVVLSAEQRLRVCRVVGG